MKLVMEKKAFEEEKYPDQRFLGEAIREGRAVRQDVSMKALGSPDLSLQSRVISFDLRHCSNLQIALKEGGKLQRVVIFRSTESGRMFLADGFHRWKATVNEKLRSIPAWVIESDDAEFEAMLYSTMCNRENCLPKTREDHKKGAFLLFARPTTWMWADSRLAVHCGVGTGTITKYRVEYAAANKLEMPTELETKAGYMRPYEKGREDRGQKRISGSRDKGYRACFGATSVSLGCDKNEAGERLATMEDDRNKRLNRLGHNLGQKYTVQGLEVKTFGLNPQTHRGLFGLKVAGQAVTWFDPRGTDTLPTAIGRALMLAAMDSKPTRAIVLCWREDCLPELVKLGEACGVAFMTPDELVEDLLSRKAS